jgi:predicted metal-dependent hydrolase
MILAVQLRLPWSRSRPESRGPSPRLNPPVHTASVGGVELPVTIARHPRARRYVLRMAADGTLRLTVPRGASVKGGLSFVARQQSWIEKERARRAAQSAEWSASTVFWWRGVRVSPAIGTDGVGIGPDQLPIGSPAASPRRAFEPWAREMATRELEPRCRALAAACGEPVRAVHIRNQRSRWGSCSPRRVIALNWRLIQTPPSVADYVMFHELMHLRQPNHSRRFWREVESVCPGWREAERWLRRHGREVL